MDLGVNIARTTSILAMREEPNGKVIAFEPHPVLFKELQYNIAAWTQNSQAASIVAHKLALRSTPGVAQFTIPAEFAMNHGVSYVACDAQANSKVNRFEAAVTTLDGVVAG